MQTIAQLFQDLEAAVIQQEPAVTQIEQRGEEVTEHVAKANTELTGAVDKARAARRKKWWCLGIVGTYSRSVFRESWLTISQSSSSLLLPLSLPLQSQSPTTNNSRNFFGGERDGKGMVSSWYQQTGDGSRSCGSSAELTDSLLGDCATLIP